MTRLCGHKVEPLWSFVKKLLSRDTSLSRSFFKKAAIEKNYTMGEKLGEGNFAVVKRAVKKGNDKSEYAIKIIDKTKVDDMNDIQVRTCETLRLNAQA